MRNKEFQKLLKKNRSSSNSGFTLTELLIGLVMSTIVIAGLGWGLMQMLTTTQRETTRVNSRNETSRAFNFIADEVKAAQTIEVDMSNANLSIVDDPATPDVDEAVAPGFTLPTGGTVRLALRVPGVTQRVIYSVAPAPNNSTWKGPLVIYRWGPNLTAAGAYSDPNNVANWTNEALIDGVSNDNQTVVCDADGDGTPENVTYQGFYACVVDDNGDGVADAEDTDGTSITAELYFAADTENGVYTTDSQVVARARVAPLRKPELSQTKLLEFESLTPQFGRAGCWTVRNDFGQGDDPTALPNSGNELTNVMTWIHEDNRRPQPINIDTEQPLTIVASAFGGLSSDCLARGNKYQREWDSTNNEYKYVDSQGNNIDSQYDDESDEDFDARLASNGVPANGGEEIHTYEHKVWHTIDFSDHDTFNGSDSSLADSPNVSREASNSPADGQSGAGEVKIFKNGDRIDSSADYQGYDADNTGNRDQTSLEVFLQSKGYVDDSGVVTLEPNQRIIAFEIGQDQAGTDVSPNPGFDLQDNIFLMTSDVFTSSN